MTRVGFMSVAPQPTASVAEVMAELERIVASPDFGKAERPARFMRHLVETTLRHEPQFLKESVLGVEVFERPASWDPRLDPIVRQEAARLRKRLDRYYQGTGAASAIRIELPVGSYVPVFRKAAPAPAPTGTKRRWAGAAAAIGAIAIGAAGFLVLRGGGGVQWAKSPAEDLYLRGTYCWAKRTPEGLTQAVDLFTQAIVRDPKYARPYVGLANTYNLLREYAAMPEEEAYPRALAATQKALDIDDRCAEAHASLAFITFWWNWNAPAAEREYRRAIQRDARYATAHHWYATFLQTRGRFDEALEQIELAQNLEPTSTAILADKGLLLYYAGRRDDAVPLLRQLAAHDPASQSSHRYLASIFVREKDYLSYLAEFKQYVAASKDASTLAILTAAEEGFAAGGARGMFEKMLETEIALNREGKRPSYWLAETCALMGRTADALRYLEKSSCEPGSLFLAYKTDPALASLRTDPEYRRLDAKFEPMIAAGTYPARH